MFVKNNQIFTKNVIGFGGGGGLVKGQCPKSSHSNEILLYKDRLKNYL